MDNNPKQRAWQGHQDEPAQTHFKLLSGALRCSHLNCFLVELSSLLFNANLIPFLWTATLPPTLPTPLPLKLPEPFFTLSLKATTINKTREAAGIPGEGWGHSVALWEHRWLSSSQTAYVMPWHTFAVILTWGNIFVFTAVQLLGMWSSFRSSHLSNPIWIASLLTCREEQGREAGRIKRVQREKWVSKTTALSLLSSVTSVTPFHPWRWVCLKMYLPVLKVLIKKILKL